eukprot:TRINITY_DN3307_c0_g1_i1.p1 TRINITY_DN3307_c0_g1~~TRINITY_DN3307_c0_g1_i1.p1  ORF type:complete len:221 (-),score=43.10 TRINITY_DN3307_c0_g1_i1:559-1221(-)
MLLVGRRLNRVWTAKPNPCFIKVQQQRRCNSETPIQVVSLPPSDNVSPQLVSSGNLQNLPVSAPVDAPVLGSHHLYQDFTSYKALWGETDLGLWGELQSSLTFVMESLHTYAGLPWWATIGLTAFGLRLALLPVTVASTKLGFRLQQAAPEIEITRKLFTEQLQEAKDDKERSRELVTQLSAQMKAIYEKHQASPLTALKYSLFQIPFFCSVFLDNPQYL